MTDDKFNKVYSSLRLPRNGTVGTRSEGFIGWISVCAQQP